MEERISEITLSLTKTLKALQMYGVKHPSFMSFYIPCYQKLNDFLKEFNELDLQIEKFTILHVNQVFYEDKEKDTSVAFRLFRDGVRNIAFLNGLTSDELLLFLEVITGPQRDEDIALNLWECDFAHVKFYVVEEEDQQITYKIPETKLENVDFDKTIAEIIKKENLTPDKSIDPGLTPDEFQKLKREIRAIRKYPLIPAAINTLINFLHYERSNEVIESLLELLEYSVNNLDFRNARMILYKLKEFVDFQPTKRFENETAIVGFKDVVDLTSDDIFNEFVAFIGFFSRKSIPHFIKLLGRVKRLDRLDALRNRIAYITQNDITPLVSFLKSDNSAILGNVINILGIIGNAEVVPHLEPLFYHPEQSIREEIILALARIGAPSKVSGFIDDPVSSVRIKALQSLTKIRYKAIYPQLLKRIKKRGFSDLDFIEKREFFNCLSATDDARSIDDLKKILFKRMLFGHKKYREIRRLAAFSLAKIKDEGALKILNNGSKSKNKDIKTFCQMALKECER